MSPRPGFFISGTLFRKNGIDRLPVYTLLCSHKNIQTRNYEKNSDYLNKPSQP